MDTPCSWVWGFVTSEDTEEHRVPSQMEHLGWQGCRVVRAGAGEDPQLGPRDGGGKASSLLSFRLGDSGDKEWSCSLMRKVGKSTSKRTPHFGTP